MVARKDGKARVFDPVKKKDRFVLKAMSKHNGEYKYPDDYINCKTPIRIICNKHGDFYQTPDSHLRGRGCAKCAKNKGGVQLSKDDIISRFEVVHGDTYNYCRVVYVNMFTEVCILCSLHSVFYQKPSTHLGGSGCPKCAGKNITEDVFILRMNEKQHSKIKYVSGFVNMTTSCVFSCEKHGEFNCKPTQYLNSKHGCRLCANESIGESLSLGYTDIVRNIEDNGLFKVISVDCATGLSYNTRTNVIVECLKHSTVERRPYHSLVKSVGCSVCLYEHKSEMKRYTKEDFVELANIVHKNTYDYCDTIYEKSNMPVNIICKIHGVFSVTPNNHLSGQKCPHCTVHSSWSKEGFVRYAESNYGGLSTIYLIRCYNDSESFIKVGHTCRTLKERFSTKNTMPYNYDVLFELKTKASMVYDLEKEVKKSFNSDKYLPDIAFGGRTECFNEGKYLEILGYIKERVNEN